MRDIIPILNFTVTPEKFEEARQAYIELDKALFDYTSHYIKLGELLTKFEKEKYYSLIRPVDTYESVTYTKCNFWKRC